MLVNFSQIVDISKLWAEQVEITNFDLTSERVKNSKDAVNDMTKLRERTNVQAAIGGILKNNNKQISN